MSGLSKQRDFLRSPKSPERCINLSAESQNPWVWKRTLKTWNPCCAHTHLVPSPHPGMGTQHGQPLPPKGFLWRNPFGCRAKLPKSVKCRTPNSAAHPFCGEIPLGVLPDSPNLSSAELQTLQDNAQCSLSVIYTEQQPLTLAIR